MSEIEAKTKRWKREINATRRLDERERNLQLCNLVDASGDDSDLLLLQMMDDRSAAIRYQALWKAEPRKGIIPRIMARAGLADPDEKVRNVASRILVDQAQRQDIPRLIRALSDSDWMVRSDASIALGFLGGVAARRALEARLGQERHSYVSRDIAVALSDIGDVTSIPRLEQALAKERDNIARVGILHALYAFGQRFRIDTLLHFLDDDDYLVRCNVISSIAAEELAPEDIDRVKHALILHIEREDIEWLKGTTEAKLQEIEAFLSNSG